MIRSRRWALGLLLSAPAIAEAHIVSTRLGDFFAGALHPLTDPADLLCWVALGLLAARAGARSARWLVVAVPLALMAGVALASLHAVPGAGVIAGVLLVGLGAVLALDRVLGLPALLIVAVATMLLRGVANAAGVSDTTDFVLYVLGVGGIGYVVMTLFMAVSVGFVEPARAGGWRLVALRVAGSWIAAIGLMLGGFALRG
jgi:hydrogenase/urease accessory protein HupE